MAERTAAGADLRGAAVHGPSGNADAPIAGMLVSPTEPRQIRGLGATSSLPERYGADVVFDAPPLGRVGVQRKTVPDLFASMSDGRLARSVAAMEALDIAVLVIEGDLRWTPEGFAEPAEGSDRPITSWRRDAYRSLLWSIRARGIWVETVPDPDATVATVLSLQRWASKSGHEALDRRPKPRDVDAGALHLLQGLAGIGPRLAARILEHFHGLPLAWTVTEDELASVRGLGPVRARRLSAALGGRHVRPADEQGTR